MWWTRRWHPPSMRASWWRSPAHIRRYGSGTTGSARRSWAGWSRSGGTPCSWPWHGGWRPCRSCSRPRRSSTCPPSARSLDAAERRQVVGLLRRAAGQATLNGDYALVNALLTAALPAVDPGDTAALAEVHAGRHAALYCLGRLEEADEVYRTIERLCPAVAGPRGHDDGAGAQPDPPDPFRGGARARPPGAARTRHHRSRSGPAPSRARPRVRLPVPVAEPHRCRRRPGPAGPHRPRAARRVRPDQRKPDGGLLPRRPRHGHLASPGSTADLR